MIEGYYGFKKLPFPKDIKTDLLARKPRHEGGGRKRWRTSSSTAASSA